MPKTMTKTHKPRSQDKQTILQATKRSELPRSCQYCKFFDEENFRGQEGYCRRMPPTRLDTMVAAWPIVGPTSWCGEFQSARVSIEGKHND